MKFLKKLVKRQQLTLEKRYAETSLSYPPKTTTKLRRSFFASRKNRSDAALTVDETSSGSSSDDAPWRAENIVLGGVFKEADWWDHQEEDDDDRDDNREEDDTLDVLDDSMKLPPEGLAGEDSLSDHSEGRRRFRNRGLETWVQARKEWKALGRDKATTVVPSTADTPNLLPTSSAGKREMIKKITDQRECVFRQRIPLKDLVGAYNEVWYGDSE